MQQLSYLQQLRKEYLKVIPVQELVPSQFAVTRTVMKHDDGIPIEFVDAQ